VDICVFDAFSHRVRKRSSDSGAAMKRYEALREKRCAVEYREGNNGKRFE
jgi:hypothetical protein